MDAARDDQDLRLKFNAGRFASICFGVFAICHAFQYEAEAVSVRSRNFIVHGPDQNVIHSVAQKAEDLRHKIAMAWLGIRPGPCDRSGNEPRRFGGTDFEFGSAS